MVFWQSKTEDTPDNIKQNWILEGFKECLDGFCIIQNDKFYISDRLIEMLGYNHDDENLLSEEWWDNIIHPDDRSRTLAYVDDRRQGKNQKKQIEYRLRHRAGHYVSLLVTTHTHPGSNGLNSYMATVVNINSYRVLQDQLERTIEEAEKTSQTKSKFIASLNHELRTPLSGIMGMANVLSATDLDENQRSYVHTILSSTQMLLTLVNDILDVSKIASGKLELERVDFDLYSVMANIKNILTPLAAAKDISLFYTLDESVPQYLVGDQVRLQQILINLINNAIKFTNIGEINITVKRHQLDPEKVSLLFRITDTGIGISPDIIPSLFQDFTQASPSTVRTHGGTGLGLSICKKLVTLMGGDIGVQSTIGKGSTFWFTIPFPIADTPQPSETPSSLEAIPELKILVAEDNTINQQVIEGILKNLGQKVSIAKNGKEALTMVKTETFDLIFMDINMPEVDGFTATKSLRSTPVGQNIPIIAFTADTITTSLEEFREAGFNDVATKPVNKQAIIQLIRQYAPSATDAQNFKKEMNIIDHGFIYSLLNEIGRETMIRLLNTYKTDADDLITKLEAEEDVEESHKSAHTLTGMSENLGIREVANTARAITMITKTGNTRPQDLIVELRQKFTVSISNINSILEKI
ncbi:ATP-binding protein [Candidatus Odyssella acanthamoebae]|uniref:ATP-binding protein n=1 Tax=Candidatus Odyssella acanthamoebae TaxID=91604 RepID=UPI00068B162A|nr:ATP-binding protein [Candidatus Paracaedibacter acanthamoebae]